MASSGLHPAASPSDVRKTREGKGNLLANLVTAADEVQSGGSGAVGSMNCEALGLLSLSVGLSKTKVLPHVGGSSSVSGPRIHCSFSLPAVSTSS